jgi:biotin synthase
MKNADLTHLSATFGQVRTDWTLDEVRTLFALPFSDLLFHAQRIHRENFNPNQVQVNTLLSIKTGACPEDCAYCAQSIRYDTSLERDELMELDRVLEAARTAKANGATRFCMGAAYRSPKPKQLALIKHMVSGVRDMGMETCVTLGMLTPGQAVELKEAGLDYYNHNLDTSERYYKEIITTRTYQDRLDTLTAVLAAGINVCSGGILGMGETANDRAELLLTLATLPAHPDSVPINQLIKIPGTPLQNAAKVDPFEFVRTIAVARLLMPKAYVRIAAGRSEMNDEMQALCFLAGANSIFYGDRLLTTDNPNEHHDRDLFARLGITPEQASPKTETPLAHRAAAHTEQLAVT